MLSRELLDFPWDLKRNWDQERGAGLLSRLPREKTLLESFGRDQPEELARIRSSGPTFYLRAVYCTVLGTLSASLVRSNPWWSLAGLIVAVGVVVGIARKWQRLFFQRAAESDYFRKRFDDLLRPQLNALRRLLQDADDFRRSLEGVEPFEYGKQHPEKFPPDVAQAIRRVHDDERNPIRSPDRRRYLARMVKELAPEEFNQGHLSNEELEALMLYYYDAEYLAVGGAGTVPVPPPDEPELSIEEEIKAGIERQFTVYETLQKAYERIEQATEHLPELQRTAERNRWRRRAEKLAGELFEARIAREKSTTDARS